MTKECKARTIENHEKYITTNSGINTPMELRIFEFESIWELRKTNMPETKEWSGIFIQCFLDGRRNVHVLTEHNPSRITWFSSSNNSELLFWNCCTWLSLLMFDSQFNHLANSWHIKAQKAKKIKVKKISKKYSQNLH